MTTLVEIIAVILAFALLLIACDCLAEWHHERQVKRKCEEEWTRRLKWIEMDNSEFARKQRQVRGEE